jgi:hypothetical protein
MSRYLTLLDLLGNSFTHKTTILVLLELLQPYPVVSADALLEIGAATISAVLSLDEHL